MSDGEGQQEDTVYRQELAKLSAIDSEKIEQFLNTIADNICGREREFDNYGESTEVGPIAAAYHRLILDTVKKNQGRAFDKRELANELLQAQVAKNLIELVVPAVVSRRPEIEQQLTVQASRITSWYLKDFDWSVRMVLASGRISAMRESVLRLKLRLKCVTDELRDVHIELTKEQLETLLTEGGQIAQVISSLK